MLDGDMMLDGEPLLGGPADAGFAGTTWSANGSQFCYSTRLELMFDGVALRLGALQRDLAAARRGPDRALPPRVVT